MKAIKVYGKKLPILGILLIAIIAFGGVYAAVVNYLNNEITTVITVKSPLTISGEITYTPYSGWTPSNQDISPVAVGESTAEWTTEEKYAGDYSVKLTMPVGTGWVNDNAEVRITLSEPLQVEEVESWSFWVRGQDASYVPIEFYLDIDGDGNYEKIIVGQRMGSMTDEWVELNKDVMSMYMAWKNGYEWLWNWGKVVEKYGNATLLRVDIGYGSLGSNEAVTAYVDDFEMNDVTYAVEPILPDPVTETLTEGIVVTFPVTFYGADEFYVVFDVENQANLPIDGKLQIVINANTTTFGSPPGAEFEDVPGYEFTLPGEELVLTADDPAVTFEPVTPVKLSIHMQLVPGVEPDTYTFTAKIVP